MYVEEALAPSLRRGQVAVMDNLSSHKGPRIRELIERRGCELSYLPPYSPYLNPIEQAFSKLKALLRRAQARTCEALVEAMGRALDAITARDTSGFFRHTAATAPRPNCYETRSSVQHSRTGTATRRMHHQGPMRLRECGLLAEISEKGKPAPVATTKRWVAERADSWHNGHKKLVWCTERCGRVVDFWVAFSDVVIVVRRLVREAWSRSAGKTNLSDDHDLLPQALTCIITLAFRHAETCSTNPPW
ncbi:MAG: transposase [Actinomycetota bacterium]|nr:transposase [Actinomycetota bacterium]